MIKLAISKNWQKMENRNKLKQIKDQSRDAREIVVVEKEQKCNST